VNYPYPEVFVLHRSCIRGATKEAQSLIPQVVLGQGGALVVNNGIDITSIAVKVNYKGRAPNVEQVGSLKLRYCPPKSNQALQRTRTASAVHDYHCSGSTAVPASAEGRR
jgi:hypothetical protein